MENFIYNDHFHPSLSELLEELEIEELNEAESLPQDWSIEVDLASVQKMIELTHEEVAVMLSDNYVERMDEDANQYDDILIAIQKSFNVDLFNELMPNMYYPTGKKQIITRKDLIEYFKD